MFKAIASRFAGGGKEKPPAQLVETIRHGCVQNSRGTCHLDGRHDSFSTSFLGLQERKGGAPFLVVDTFMPRLSRSALVERETSIAIHFTVAQIPYRGDFVYHGVTQWEGFDALLLTLPTKLTERQRREHFRVEPKIANPIHIRITGPVEGAGEVIDISQGGARIRTMEPVAPGEMAEVFLAMPTTPGAWLELKAKVVESGELPKGMGKRGDQRHFIRLQFVNPEPDREREITQYIVIRQREDLKFLS